MAKLTSREKTHTLVWKTPTEDPGIVEMTEAMSRPSISAETRLTLSTAETLVDVGVVVPGTLAASPADLH